MCGMEKNIWKILILKTLYLLAAGVANCAPPHFFAFDNGAKCCDSYTEADGTTPLQPVRDDKDGKIIKLPARDINLQILHVSVFMDNVVMNFSVFSRLRRSFSLRMPGHWRGRLNKLLRRRYLLKIIFCHFAFLHILKKNLNSPLQALGHAAAQPERSPSKW